MKHQMEVNSKHHTIYSHIGPKTDTVTIPQYSSYCTHNVICSIVHRDCNVKGDSMKQVLKGLHSILTFLYMHTSFHRIPAPHTPAKYASYTLQPNSFSLFIT